MRSETPSPNGFLAVAALAVAALSSTAAAQQPARAPFAGFDPGRCVIAARIVDDLVTRGTPDTAVYRPGTDTLATITSDSIRLCQSSFGGTTDAPTERLNLARTQLFLGEDAAAGATQAGHLAAFASRPVPERAWELSLVARDALAGKPARLARADSAIAELDRIGKVAATVRVGAHLQRASAAFSRYDDAKVDAATNAAIAAWKELDEETGLWRAGELASVFLMRAHLAALTKDGEAARAVIDTARGVIPPKAEQARRMIEAAGQMYQVMDKAAAPVAGTFWFNVAASERRRPTKGKASIILEMGRPCTFSCPHMVQAMKRFDRRYRDRGLEITFQTRTFGFYVDTAPASPYEEARWDSTYFVGELALPGAIAIEETEYTWRPDGRRLNSPTLNQSNYPHATIAIVDRRGIVRYVAGNWSPALEARYAKMIEALLAEPAGP